MQSSPSEFYFMLTIVRIEGTTITPKLRGSTFEFPLHYLNNFKKNFFMRVQFSNWKNNLKILYYPTRSSCRNVSTNLFLVLNNKGCSQPFNGNNDRLKIICRIFFEELILQ